VCSRCSILKPQSSQALVLHDILLGGGFMVHICGNSYILHVQMHMRIKT
jgi:hypothetical protein